MNKWLMVLIQALKYARLFIVTLNQTWFRFHKMFSFGFHALHRLLLGSSVLSVVAGWNINSELCTPYDYNCKQSFRHS